MSPSLPHQLLSSTIFRSWAGYLVAAVVLVSGWAIHSLALLNHDIAWFLIAAGRMLEGGSYLRDFFEVNMPLAIGAYIPPLAVAHGLGLSLQAALTACVCLLAVQAAFLLPYLLSSGPAPLIDRAFVPWFGTWLLLGLLFLPGYDLGEREHLMVLLCLPFVGAVAHYAGLRALPLPLRVYIALLAAIGCFLKPYYAGLPFLLLGATALAQRSWAPLRSPEMLVLLLAAAGNAALVTLLYPDWFIVARWASDLYVGYGREQMLHGQMLFKVKSAGVMLAALAVQALIYWRVRPVRPLLGPFLLSACYFWLAFAAQQKGWYYHFIPFMLLIWAGQIPALAGSLASAGGEGRLLAASAAAVMLGLALTAVGDARNMPAAGDLKGLPRVLAAEPPGENVYVFSWDVWPFLPAVPMAGLNWASRYSPLWPLHELARSQLEGLPDAARLDRSYHAPLAAFVVEDFKRYRPGLVIVDRTEPFDIMAFFLADRDFAVLWQDYAEVGSIKAQGGGPLYTLYHRIQAPLATE